MSAATDYVVADVPLGARIYGVPTLHRLLPAAPAVALASLAGVSDRWRPDRLKEALDRAHTLLGDGHPDAPRLARRHLREQRMADELFWRPWLTPGVPVVAGRGQIVVGLHLGPMAHLQLGLARHLQAAGRSLYVSRWQAAADEPPQTGRRALYTPVKVARLEAAGAVVVPRGGSYARLRSLLEQGETVWMAADVAAGSRPATAAPAAAAALLGHRVRLASGISALAFQTGVGVIPAYALRVRHRATVVLEAPLDPAGFAGPEALHDHLAAWADATLRRHLAQAMPELALTIGWAPRT